MWWDKLGSIYTADDLVTNGSSAAVGCNWNSSGAIATPKSKIVMDVLVSPGKKKQILPNWASSVAQILMQSADSSECASESVSAGGLHTIHSPLNNIVGTNSQIARLRSISRDVTCETVKACTLRNQPSQQIFRLVNAFQQRDGCRVG